ncbi:MAG: hypothetical protein H6635_03115 [Anaerolineales bacterium]|nr:hypothetical protein [Anaerolineales bacterium]MCB9144333.1 hypothetical protein [Anaerolineales bacterium]
MSVVTNTIYTLAYGISGVAVTGIAMMLILLALVRKDPSMMFFGALFSIPATFVSGSWADWGGIFMRLMPLFPALGAYAVAQDDTVFSWVLAAPVLGYLIFYLFKLILAGM